MHPYIILDNGSGEIDREPVTDNEDSDAFKEAIERLVARTGFFAIGDIIKVVG